MKVKDINIKHHVFRMLDFTDLLIFEGLSTGKTAYDVSISLGLSPSALSMRFRKHEDIFPEMYLKRGRRVSLSKEGILFAERVSKVMKILFG